MVGAQYITSEEVEAATEAQIRLEMTLALGKKLGAVDFGMCQKVPVYKKPPRIRNYTFKTLDLVVD